MALGGLIDVEAVQVSRDYVEHRFRTGCRTPPWMYQVP